MIEVDIMCTGHTNCGKLLVLTLINLSSAIHGNEQNI